RRIEEHRRWGREKRRGWKMEEESNVVLRGCSSEAETEPETHPIEIPAVARSPIILPAAARSPIILLAAARSRRLPSSPLVHSAIAGSQ
ncbi:hypothetical protein ACLOJK_025400, partial [Asimina triloba]